jgi:hypothetical protein
VLEHPGGLTTAKSDRNLELKGALDTTGAANLKPQFSAEQKIKSYNCPDDEEAARAAI